MACMLMIMSLCMPIQTFASSTELKEIPDLTIIEDDKFSKLVEQILSIKQQHPEWSIQQIKEFVDESCRIEENSRGNIADIWSVLTDSEKKLVIRYPFDALKVNKAKNIATDQTINKFGSNGLGDRSDAFRHGIWNAEMTILIGEKKAELFATAHEDKDLSGIELDGYLKVEHKNMDLHNNEIGRKVGRENLEATEMELGDLIYNMIYQSETEFMWLHE